MVINKVVNEEYGIEAVVTQIGASRFSVALHDTDADAYVPEIHIYSDLAAANAYAHKIANLTRGGCNESYQET